MLAKTYGIYDSVQQEYVRTFNARNDDDARRAAEYIVAEKGFDDKAGKDRSIFYLYSLDTEKGLVVDNDVHVVVNLATLIEKRKQDDMEIILRQKFADEQFVNEVKEAVLVQIKGEVLNGERNNDSNNA